MRDEIKNIRDVWNEGYERLLHEARTSGAVDMLASDDERRRHPRFRVVTHDVVAMERGAVQVEDMSLSGLAFRCGSDLQSGEELTVSLANVFSTETEVLACERLPKDGPGGAPRFRVRCRFKDEEHGLQFLTLTLELERVERS